MVNLSRINKFGGKKQNSEDESVVELTSCMIEVFLKSEKKLHLPCICMILLLLVG